MLLRFLFATALSLSKRHNEHKQDWTSLNKTKQVWIRRDKKDQDRKDSLDQRFSALNWDHNSISKWSGGW